jgi:hypothetical protein
MTSPRADTAEHPLVGEPATQQGPLVAQASGVTVEGDEHTVLTFPSLSNGVPPTPSVAIRIDVVGPTVERPERRTDRARAVRRRRAHAIAGIACLAGTFGATVVVLDMVH